MIWRLSGGGTVRAGRAALAAAALVVTLVAGARAASAQTALAQASAAFEAGDYPRAAGLAESVARSAAPLDRRDRAEAWRILALARCSLDQLGAAGDAFYAHLRLEPDASLDASVASPECVAVFESVRSAHQAELTAMHRKKRNAWLSVVPVLGQWQNGERGKMWAFAGGIAGLVAINVGTYLALRHYCGSPGSANTCDEGVPGEPGYRDHTSAARALQVANVAAGIGALALATYAAIDGYRTYRRLEREEAEPEMTGPLSVEVGEPATGGVELTLDLHGHF